MTEEKFTQGEWTAHLGIMEPTFVFIGKEDEYVDGETPVICELHHGIKKERPGNGIMDFNCTEMRANAALIAAAPKMYRMLKYLADGIRFGGLQHTDRSLAAEIEKLLKKARGEK